MSSSATTAIRSAKSQLRQQMKSVLKSLTAEDKLHQSRVVTERLMEEPAFQSAKSVSIFLSMPDEIQTLDIMKHIFSANKKCYIPRYFSGSNKMEMVLLRDLTDYENLPLTKWNIKQPSNDEVREEALEKEGIDVMLMPGLAFTLDGHRLGRGAGYYDTYLSKCKEKHKLPQTIALAFRQQVIHDVPVDDNDFIIDHVIFDNHAHQLDLGH